MPKLGIIHRPINMTRKCAIVKTAKPDLNQAILSQVCSVWFEMKDIFEKYWIRDAPPFSFTMFDKSLCKNDWFPLRRNFSATFTY